MKDGLDFEKLMKAKEILCSQELPDKIEVEVHIPTFARTLLKCYSEWMEKHGYLDSDWWSEGNTVDEYLEIVGLDEEGQR